MSHPMRRAWVIVLFLLAMTCAASGCGSSGASHFLPPEFARQLRDHAAGSPGRSQAGSLLVVFTYGNTCAGDGPGNGLRDVADTIRRNFREQRVITRGWDDDDGIEETVRQHRGPVALIGHSFGGCRSIELAGAVGRAVDWLIVLDPVPCDDWAFRHKGKYFEIPASVRNAVCYYRPAGFWPISYPIVNRPASVNRLRNLGHAEFCSNGEVRQSILSACAQQQASLHRQQALLTRQQPALLH